MESKKIEFTRIMGGIGWPGQRPGFVVVVGMEKFPKIGTNNYNIHVLDEAEDVDLKALFKHADRFMTKYNFEDFFCRYDRAFTNLADEFSLHRKPFFYSAPFSENGDISYHIRTLKGLLDKGDKSLHLSKTSNLPGHLQEISLFGDTMPDLKYPAVAALGYAVTGLRFLGPLDDEDNEDYPDDDDIDDTTGY